jgi:hypothetical protein
MTASFTPEAPPPNGQYHGYSLRIVTSSDAGVTPFSRAPLVGYVLDAGL